MKYTIQKISIDKENAEKLISKMAAEVDKTTANLNKRPYEFWLCSEDEKIDIWFKVEFHSEYRYANGGVEITNRTAKVDITMTYNETGEEIEYDCPVAIEEELEKVFYI